MTTRFVIVRHGNTFGTDAPPRRIGIGTDLPLVESGREQARRLGAYFATQGWRFVSIRCSPLLRTYQTAEAILAEQTAAIAIETSSLLSEIDHGPDENRLEDEVIARVGAGALTDWDEEGLAPAGWIVDRPNRLKGWRQLFAQRPDGLHLLVTSNGAARFALLADPHLADQARRFRSLKLRTGAFGIIAVDDAGPRLAAWNESP